MRETASELTIARLPFHPPNLCFHLATCDLGPVYALSGGVNLHSNFESKFTLFFLPVYALGGMRVGSKRHHDIKYCEYRLSLVQYIYKN